jgi:bifunctional non-homologous end joining protein LigD
MKEGAPVAAPVAWEELDAGVRADSFNVENMPARLEGLEADPWEGYFRLRQRLKAAALRELGLAGGARAPRGS